MFIIGGFDTGVIYCGENNSYEVKDLLIPVGENRLYDTENNEYLTAVGSDYSYVLDDDDELLF